MPGEGGSAADRSGWRSLVWPPDEVVAELRSRTVRRVRTAALLAVPVHVAHLVVFALTGAASPAERTWRAGILAAHAVLLVYAVAARWGATRALRSPEGLLARGLPWVTGAVWVGAGAAIAGIDQLVTASITPFLVGTLVAGLVLILPPPRAVLLYLAGLAGFAVLVSLVQADASVVVSNQVNGVTAAALGIGITVLQWRSEVRDVEKSGRIEAQQAELEARNVELDHLASHDPLTGLVNRRQFEVLAEHELAAARRQAWPLSLIQLDVDDFKQVNDRFGHPTGDALLRELAVLLGARLRDSDVLARWGGEEFLVLLPRTDLAGAAESAEQLRRAVAETTFVGAEEVAVTVSVGVARVDAGRAAAIEEAYRDADRALYAAKAAGRDRVVVSPGPVEPVPPTP